MAIETNDLADFLYEFNQDLFFKFIQEDLTNEQKILIYSKLSEYVSKLNTFSETKQNQFKFQYATYINYLDVNDKLIFILETIKYTHKKVDTPFFENCLLLLFSSQVISVNQIKQILGNDYIKYFPEIGHAISDVDNFEYLDAYFDYIVPKRNSRIIFSFPNSPIIPFGSTNYRKKFSYFLEKIKEHNLNYLIVHSNFYKSPHMIYKKPLDRSYKQQQKEFMIYLVDTFKDYQLAINIESVHFSTVNIQTKENILSYFSETDSNSSLRFLASSDNHKDIISQAIYLEVSDNYLMFPDEDAEQFLESDLFIEYIQSIKHVLELENNYDAMFNPDMIWKMDTDILEMYKEVWTNNEYRKRFI